MSIFFILVQEPVGVSLKVGDTNLVGSITTVLTFTKDGTIIRRRMPDNVDYGLILDENRRIIIND